MGERWACRLVNQPRGTQRYRPRQREDEDLLTQTIIALAKQYGRYGYRRITALLQRAGWRVGKDRVERIWRREGLKIPPKHKPLGRLCEFMNGEIFYSIKELRVLAECWRVHYNTIRPHSSLGYRPQPIR